MHTICYATFPIFGFAVICFTLGFYTAGASLSANIFEFRDKMNINSAKSYLNIHKQNQNMIHTSKNTLAGHMWSI